jgi:hypothetical protein
MIRERVGDYSLHLAPIATFAWVLLGTLMASRASAQSTGPADPPQGPAAPTQTAAPAGPDRPPYLPYRFDEDWHVMRDPARRTDWWDSAKYVPLKDNDWYLTLGGESRLRYEQFDNSGFGAQPQTESGYLLQRYLFHTDWHVGPHVRIFGELQSGLENGRNGGPRPTDEDKLDLHQAFTDVTFGEPKRGSVTLRVGRQEVAFGTGRLISAAEGLNVRRSFDGVRAIAHRGTWTFNSTLMRLVETKKGVFDDRPDPSQLFWGAGGQGPHPWLRGAYLAVYYFGSHHDGARFDRGVADNKRRTLGTRTWGRAGGFDYDEEVIGQVGTFGQADVRAWAVASDDGYTWREAPGRPRAGVRTFVASGDGNPHDSRLGSFDPLFPGIAYSGRAVLIGPTNLINLDPGITFVPRSNVTVTGDWAWFCRTSTHDGLYGINVALLRTGQLSRSRAVGSQGTVEVEWRADRHLTVWGSVVYFRAGQFMKETPPGEDIRYIAIYSAYRF